MHTRIAIAATLAAPAALHAQSLFHAPMPPQQPYYQPQQQPQQPPPAPAPQPQAPTPAPANGTPPAATPPAAAPAPQPAPQPQQMQPVEAAQYIPAPTAEQVSLFAVKPTKPHKFNKQDKVQIIVAESSMQSFDQKFDGKETNTNSAAITDFPDIGAIYTNGVLVNNGKPTLKIGAGNGANYKGDGSYERKDRFTARISAIVTDVKPNGMLVLEGRKTILSDKESQSMVVSGLCDPKDITSDNTVTSSQLANLVIKKENGGDVKDAATKGWFPRLFDALTGNNP